MEPVRIGVIGLGRFGRLHAATTRGLSEARLVGLVAQRQSSLDAVAEVLPGIPGWLNLEQALRECDAEAWIVACSTAAHVSVTRQLLEAGKKVLLEKPVADNLAEAMQLAPYVQPDSSNLMMGHIILFNSEFRTLRNEAQTRGPIALIDAVRHRPASIVKQFPGENPLYAVMIHDLYAVQVLLDRAEPNYFHACYHRTPTGEIDLALAQLKWPGGAVASLTASLLTPAGMPARGFDRTEVFGEGWSARINTNPRPVEVWDAQAGWPSTLEIMTGTTERSGDSVAVASGMLAEELRCFCRVVQGRACVPVGAAFQDALQVQRWMERLEVSANQL